MFVDSSYISIRFIEHKSAGNHFQFTILATHTHLPGGKVVLDETRREGRFCLVSFL